MKLANLTPSQLLALVALAVLAMLGLQGLFEYRILAPLRLDGTRLQADIQELKSQRGADAPTQPKSKARLDEILLQLQNQKTTAVRIERLHQMASEYGVQVRKANYKRQPLSGELLRHEIQAELSGTYPGIRQFLRAMLAEDQAAALESIEFSRPSASAIVRAQVHIALYSHSPAP